MFGKCGKMKTAHIHNSTPKCVLKLKRIQDKQIKNNRNWIVMSVNFKNRGIPTNLLPLNTRKFAKLKCQ